MTTAPRISVFPKCYFDELVTGRRNYVEWIHDAATLGGEGVEHWRKLKSKGYSPLPPRHKRRTS